MKRLLFLLACIAMMSSTCDKPPVYDVVPQITFSKFSKDTIQQNTGVVTFFVKFTDGDGDIGTEEVGVTNMIFVDDRRTAAGDTIFYTIPPIPKRGASDAISGEIEVDMAQICCRDPRTPIICNVIPNTYQEVSFLVQIKDNSGNWSNAIRTTPLKLKCFEQ
jgi:hypothetical protein